ncbi:MAG TPA: 7TM diverse intracellular signaling domain-containing protein [Steroidobacteraceae bacterium]|nr:7TM diverse intracellular signaling domain-containing protein [Steroidobacteraceae bacterium]
MNWDRFRPLLYLLGLLALPLLAAAATIDSAPGLPVGAPADIGWLKDPGGSMDLAAAQAARSRFLPANGRLLNFGFSRAAYWLHFSLQSRATGPTTVYLTISQPTLDDVRLYAIGPQGAVQLARAGDELPQRQHSVPGSYPILPIQLLPGASYQIYLRAASRMGVMQLPMQLQSAAQLEHATRTTLLINGMFMGAVAVLLVYNLLLWLSLRRRAYFYYVLLVPLAFLLFTALDGFGPWLLYPNLPWLANQGLVLLAGGAFLASVQFTRHLLATAGIAWIDRLLLGCAAMAALMCLATPLAPDGRVYPILFSLVFITPLVGLLTGVVCARRGHPQARFYLLAQLAAASGTLMFGVTASGALPYSFAPREAIMGGVVLQALLLSLALADQIRALQRATRDAQDATRQALSTRQQDLQRSEERTRELEEARRRAEHLATIDVLTGVYNRRGMLPRGQEAIERSVRLGAPVSLISFDVDQFKRINDDFGHAEGDRVLCQLVQMTRQLIHPQDLLGRVGGEEFLLLVSAPSERAAQIAEQLRAHLHAGLRAGPEQRAVTASFGVASLSRRLSTLETLQRAADAALYRAKHHGGNRVETFTSGQESTRTRAIMHLVRAEGGSDQGS